MGWRKLRLLLKDRLSLLTSSSPARAAVLRAAVLRATAFSLPSSSPPSERCLHDLVHLGRESRLSASACVSSLLARLSSSPDAYVSLKCLLALHVLVVQGTFILHEQILSSLNGRNTLNLSSFRDRSDPTMWHLSSLVRWYASFLESVLLASKRLSCFYTSVSHTENRDDQSSEKWVVGLGNSELLREAEALADVLECACEMPSTSGCDLVCEIMSKVVDDYGATRREILRRAREMGDRIDRTLTDDDTDDSCVDEFGRVLERLRDCEAKARVVFGNKRNNDGLWEAVASANIKVTEVAEKRRAQKSIEKFAESISLVRVEASRWHNCQGSRLSGGGHRSDTMIIGRDLVPIPAA